jgi:hypothetical protein
MMHSRVIKIIICLQYFLLKKKKHLTIVLTDKYYPKKKKKKLKLDRFTLLWLKIILIKLCKTKLQLLSAL